MSRSIIGIIKEGKVPPDNRTPLTPHQARELQDHFPNLKIFVQSSNVRCFDDEEYKEREIAIEEDISHCSLLLGIKEVPPGNLIESKTYMFFSHTTKQQEYNRKLLQTILAKNIRLIDYELLTDSNGNRFIGFGRFAGLVGAYMALMMWGKKQKSYELPLPQVNESLKEMLRTVGVLKIPRCKIVITGSGRVANGALEIMKAAKIRRVTKTAFVNRKYDEPVYVQLYSSDLYQNSYNFGYDRDDFHENPQNFDSLFQPYTEAADILINAMFWDPRAPRLFEKEDAARKNFRMRTIADIALDIEGSVPITFKHTTLAEPVYGYNPHEAVYDEPYQPHTLDIMAVDNLPNALPRDASIDFGDAMSKTILPRFYANSEDPIFKRATIACDGKLTPDFKYLQEFVDTVVEEKEQDKGDESLSEEDSRL